MRRVTVGIIGCGNIFPAYAGPLTRTFGQVVDVKACADIVPERATSRAAEFGIRQACSPEALLADPDVELVVNLTVPQAHYDVNIAALEAGKHVFAEKPLAVTRYEAERTLETAASRGLRFGGAADTFLGAGLQACRRVIDEGAIGVPIAAMAFLAMGVQTEAYHKVGVGPMLDMGPYYLTALIALLGPARRATGATHIPFAQKPRRDRETGEVRGTFTVETPTVVSGVLDFRSGCLGTVTTTTEIFGYWPRLEVYGTEGILTANDPNSYAGPVSLQLKSGERREVPLTGYQEQGRGLGVAEMALAIAEERSPRASGDLMYHVQDIMCALHEASADGRHVALRSACDRPAPFDVAALLGQP